MNIVQVNVEHGRGGAALVMSRLHHAFRARGHTARMVARLNTTGAADPDVALLPGGGRARFWLDRVWELALGMPRWAYPASRRIAATPPGQSADLIQLHNLHGGYFNYRALPQLARRKPLVWTLHDMWALTGGCAHALDCTRWQNGCGACPLLQAGQRGRFTPRPPWRDTTAREHRQKRSAYRSAELTVVAPSRWLADLAARSGLADHAIHHIPNGVACDRFRPHPDPAAVRAELGVLPQEAVLLFVAQSQANPLKGFPDLLAALAQLPADLPLTLIALGDATAVPAAVAARYRVIAPGYVWDEARLSALYSCADLFISPTQADNAPLAVLEALACGTPVAAFAVGGVPELVQHDVTGYLARPGETADLARGILELLRNPDLRRRLGENGRRSAVAAYDLDVQAERYLALYRDVLVRAAHAGGRP